MSMVNVYSFRRYDIIKGENVIGRRKATREFIRAIGATAIEATEEQVDAPQLDGNGLVR